MFKNTRSVAVKIFALFFGLMLSAQSFAQIATVQSSAPANNLVRGATDATLTCFTFTPTTTPVTIDKIKVGVVKVGFTTDWSVPGVLNASLGNFQVQNEVDAVLALVPQLESCTGVTLTQNSWSCELDLVPDLVFATTQSICYKVDLAESGPITGVALMRGELQVTATMNASNGMGPAFVPTTTVQGPNRVLDPQQIFKNDFE